MANPNRVVGQSRVKVDGAILETDGATQLEIGGPVRTAQRGDYQAGAFSETTAESKATLNILYKGSLKLSDVRLIDNATLTVETDVGTTWVVRNAYVAEVISFDTSNGKAQVVMQGPPAEEL
jgi:hypothetical protein